MKKSIVKSTAVFSALGCLSVVLSAVVEFFPVCQAVRKMGIKIRHYLGNRGMDSFTADSISLLGYFYFCI